MFIKLVVFPADRPASHSHCHKRLGETGPSQTCQRNEEATCELMNSSVWTTPRSPTHPSPLQLHVSKVTQRENTRSHLDIISSKCGNFTFPVTKCDGKKEGNTFHSLICKPLQSNKVVFLVLFFTKTKTERGRNAS